MTQDQVIQAWKSPAYRASLNPSDLKALPSNPAGVVDLNERELTEVSGGTTFPCGVAVGIVISLIIP